MISRKLYLSITALAVTIMACVVSVFAWFINAGNGTYGGVEIDADPVLETVVSLDGTSWGESLVFGATDYNFSLLSGTGSKAGDKVNLVRPQVDENSGVVKVNTQGHWLLEEDPVANQDYIEFDLFVKTNLQSELAFSDQTYIRALYADAFARLDKRSRLGYEESQFGTFSIDYLSSASRMSINKVEGDGETLLCLWAPNENVRLRCVDTVSQRFVLYTEESQFLTDETEYPSASPFVYLQRYSFYDNSIQTEREVKQTDDWFYTDLSQFTYSIQPSDAVDGHFEVHFVVRIWIEGCDQEAHTALATGNAQIDINLALASYLEV